MKTKLLSKILWATLLVTGVGCADSALQLVAADDDEPAAGPGAQNSNGGPAGWNDSDGDGVVDRFDNCTHAVNPNQEDSDRDAVGDACDNCVNTANLNQVDSDGNGLGDACEWEDAPDRDQDGIPDAVDNCINVPNADQADSDFDGHGNVCDNCPAAANPGQGDHDNDGIGNECDGDFAGELCYSEEFRPDVSTVEPAIYLMLDASGSMADELDPTRPHPWPIEEAVDAIGTVADRLAPMARIGLGQFPFQQSSGSTCTMQEHVSVGANSAATIRNATSGINAIGNTPTGFALNSVLDRGLLDDGADPFNARRPKAVILVTDGDPTVACATGTPDNRRVAAQPEAVNAAARLKAAGIPVYVIGFQSGAVPANLDEIAAAGGTDAPGGNRFYNANNPTELVNAIQDITQKIVSCSYQLGAVPQNMDRMSVSVDGQPVPQDAANGYSYDAFAQIVTLNGATCDGIKNAPDPAQKRIQVDITCATGDSCTPAPEACDAVDNDCDGVADEGDICSGDRVFEVCDGVDNDGNGQIDEGCPICRLIGDSCTDSSDCCNSDCVGGVCTAECRPNEVACVNNSDCCSGMCSGSAMNPGVCLTQ